MPIKILQLTLLGVVIGIWLTLSGGTFFVLAYVFIIFCFLNYHIPKEDRNFILKVIIFGLLARLFLAAAYYYFWLLPGNMDILGPDGEAYSQRGWYISRLLLNHNPYEVPISREFIFSNYSSMVEYYKHLLPPVGIYQAGVFTYSMGILYAIFGYAPLMIKLINSALSVLTAVTIYFISREIFNSKVGKASMVLIIFLPSIFLFSATALKDSAVIFLLTFLIWLIVKFQKTKNIMIFGIVLAMPFLVDSLRSRMTYPLLLLVSLSLLLSLRINFLKKLIIAVSVLIFAVSIPSFRNIAKRTLDPENFFSAHIGYINTPGNNYKIFPDRCYKNGRLVGAGPIEITEATIRGIFHFLYEPLPNRVKDNISLFAFFQSALQYLFVPFIVIGFFIGLKYRGYEMIPIAVFFLIFIPLIALSEGNVGTVFRHRDMLMPFFIMLGIVGLYAKVLKKSPL